MSTVEFVRCSGMSFTNDKNSVGPKTLPCGTPCLLSRESDLWPSILTNCWRPERYHSNHDSKGSLTLYRRSFVRNSWWSTTSNAFLKSTKTIPECILLASPKVRTKITLGDRWYSCAAPRLWNLLPSTMQSISSLNLFKKKNLKLSYLVRLFIRNFSIVNLGFIFHL